MFLNLMPNFDFSDIRWTGTLHRIAFVFLGALLLVGLAAAHRFRAQSGLHVVWLGVIYIGLVVVMPLMVAILVTWGFVDNWLRSRPAPVASRA